LGETCLFAWFYGVFSKLVGQSPGDRFGQIETPSFNLKDIGQTAG
jgi:hypothetical protein